MGQEKETEKAENLAEENKCYNQDGTKNDKEHIFDFRPEAGLVCQVCGLVGLEIENMWERDVRLDLLIVLMHIVSVAPEL